MRFLINPSSYWKGRLIPENTIAIIQESSVIREVIEGNRRDYTNSYMFLNRGARTVATKLPDIVEMITIKGLALVDFRDNDIIMYEIDSDGFISARRSKFSPERLEIGTKFMQQFLADWKIN